MKSAMVLLLTVSIFLMAMPLLCRFTTDHLMHQNFNKMQSLHHPTSQRAQETLTMNGVQCKTNQFLELSSEPSHALLLHSPMEVYGSVATVI